MHCKDYVTVVIHRQPEKFSWKESSDMHMDVQLIIILLCAPLNEVTHVKASIYVIRVALSNFIKHFNQLLLVIKLYYFIYLLRVQKT